MTGRADVPSACTLAPPFDVGEAADEEVDTATLRMAERLDAVVARSPWVTADRGLRKVATGDTGLGTSGGGDVPSGAGVGLTGRGASPCRRPSVQARPCGRRRACRPGGVAWATSLTRSRASSRSCCGPWAETDAAVKDSYDGDVVCDVPRQCHVSTTNRRSASGGLGARGRVRRAGHVARGVCGLVISDGDGLFARRMR